MPGRGVPNTREQKLNTTFFSNFRAVLGHPGKVLGWPVVLAAQCEMPPHIAQYPFETASQRGVSHAFCLVFIGYRASIAEIPLLRGGELWCLHFACSPRGKRSEKGEGVSHPSGHVEKPKSPYRAIGGIAEIGPGKRGHHERGLFTGGISRISRISRRWSDSPLCSRVWGFSRISKFSRISRKWVFLKRPLLQKIPFSEPNEIVSRIAQYGATKCIDLCPDATYNTGTPRPSPPPLQATSMPIHPPLSTAVGIRNSPHLFGVCPIDLKDNP